MFPCRAVPPVLAASTGAGEGARGAEAVRGDRRSGAASRGSGRGSCRAECSRRGSGASPGNGSCRSERIWSRPLLLRGSSGSSVSRGPVVAPAHPEAAEEAQGTAAAAVGPAVRHVGTGAAGQHGPGGEEAGREVWHYTARGLRTAGDEEVDGSIHPARRNPLLGRSVILFLVCVSVLSHRLSNINSTRVQPSAYAQGAP